ncbi:hypothetical protein BI347_11230 [Chromobacterium sphagni]|uniref:Uncharacterized protein n=2 Tax=Chromobacterium sphagni TaxID=1903179 RepID=A0A1S1X466_9NEIS|nr:hypothetical protein BI347_11230 [Chromobacterium sphagni]
MRSEHAISKQIIATIFAAKNAMENSSSINIEVRNNIDLANKFLLLLEMIAKDEEPMDRKPGVPRII